MRLACLCLLVLTPAAGAVDLETYMNYPVSYICIEAETGLVVAEQYADLRRPPASMLKMKLMLLVLEGLEERRWTLDQQIPISARAESAWGTQVHVKAGESWPLEHLMRGIAVASANDASVAVAEGLWGSVENCLAAMNRRARELGMLDTVYHGVNGLPPEEGTPFDQTTARDMAVLARHCVRHPLMLQWSREPEFSLRPGNAARANTNRLLTRMHGCDGLKTGFIRAAGFCVTATAERDGLRFITVVMGLRSNAERFRFAQEKLEMAFQRVARQRLVFRGQETYHPVEIPNGKLERMHLEVANDIWLILPREDHERVRLSATIPERIYAPVQAGRSYGELRVELDGNVLAKAPLIAPVPVDARGWYLSFTDDGVARWEGLDAMFETN